MPQTLFITGSLAPRAMARRLSGESGDLVVLEYDTLLDRARYPQVRHWLTMSDLVPYAEIEGFRKEIGIVMEPYLRFRPELGDLPGDVSLRKASLQGAFQDACFTQMLNSRLQERLWERFDFDKVIVTAGAGVSFDFWRGLAAERGLSVEILPPEWRSRSLGRKIQRWLYKRKAKQAKPAPPPPPASPPAGNGLILCASKRLSWLLKMDGLPPVMALKHVTVDDLGEPDPAIVAKEGQRFQNWWQQWQKQVLEPACAPGADATMARYRSLMLRIGEHHAQKVYPHWLALREKAKAWLIEHRPQMVLSDTQVGDDDSIWSLAAADLGIPVASHTYDYPQNPRLMFMPDFLLADGRRSIPRSVEHGYPENRIIDVRSHRRPAAPPRSAEQLEALFTQSRPQVLCADTMTLMTDPQACLRHYRTIIGAARRLPQMDFIVKYHPLRTGKSEARSFIGMDESEVQTKTSFIRALRPPKNFILLPPEATMEQCMESTAILLNTISLSGQEAFHLGIPVVFMIRHVRDYVVFPEMEDWMQPLEAENEDELVRVLTQLKDSREFRQARVAEQHRYQDQFFWSSKLTLTDSLAIAIQRAAVEPLLPK